MLKISGEHGREGGWQGEGRRHKGAGQKEGGLCKGEGKEEEGGENVCLCQAPKKAPLGLGGAGAVSQGLRSWRLPPSPSAPVPGRSVLRSGAGAALRASPAPALALAVSSAVCSRSRVQPPSAQP